jgi:hypothetical protein
MQIKLASFITIHHHLSGFFSRMVIIQVLKKLKIFSKLRVLFSLFYLKKDSNLRYTAKRGRTESNESMQGNPVRDKSRAYHLRIFPVLGKNSNNCRIPLPAPCSTLFGVAVYYHTHGSFQPDGDMDELIFGHIDKCGL